MDQNIINVTTDNFETEVLDAEQKVLIDFWAPWCAPCRALSPAIDDVANQFAGLLKVVKVNVDEAPEISRQYGIRSIPTLILFDKGLEVERLRSSSRGGLFTFLNNQLATDIRPSQADVPAKEKKSRQSVFSAFNGNAQLKAETVERAALGASDGRIRGLPGRFNPDTDAGSPFAWLLGSHDIADAEERLGIPEGVAALYEYLYFNFLYLDITNGQVNDSVRPDALPLFQHWLSAIEPGKDLRNLPSAFLPVLVRQLLKGDFTPLKPPAADQAEVLGLLASVHEQIATGNPVRDSDTKKLHDGIQAISRDHTDDWSQTLASFADNASRTIDESPRAVAAAVMDLLIGYRNALNLLPYSSEELQLRQQAATAVGLAKQAEPGASQSTLEALPEVVAWYQAAPIQRQSEISLASADTLAKLAFVLHDELIALT